MTFFSFWNQNLSKQKLVWHPSLVSREQREAMHGAGMIVLCAFVSPTRNGRNRVRNMLPSGAFLEVYCKCPAEVCEQRDSKGFYASARAGKLEDYTGVSPTKGM